MCLSGSFSVRSVIRLPLMDLGDYLTVRASTGSIVWPGDFHAVVPGAMHRARPGTGSCATHGSGSVLVHLPGAERAAAPLEAVGDQLPVQSRGVDSEQFAGALLLAGGVLEDL